jgi:tetratricopeptide (TPR) repeat protein
MPKDPPKPRQIGPDQITDRVPQLGPDAAHSDTMIAQVDEATSDTRLAVPGPAVVDEATSDTQLGQLPPSTPRPASLPPTQGPTTAPELPAGGDFDAFVSVDPRYYERGAEVARGGMGRILAARDRRLGREVAIKELLVDSDELRTRFEREARITARLQHPAIVSVIEAGQWPTGEPFYVMRYVSGETLDARIRACTSLAERLALLPNLIAVVDALAYAHDAGVIHRDLKPANVLIGSFGETVVIDWGLAKDLRAGVSDPTAPPSQPPRAPQLGDEDATVVGSVMGTPAYMPLEQAQGAVVDQRADVYALGAMLYQLLTGAPPYAGTASAEVLARVLAAPPAPVESRVTGVPPDLLTIVAKSMAREPAARYPSAVELAEDLKRFQTGQLVGSHQYSARERLVRWARRHRTAVRVGAVAALVLVLISGLSLRRILRERARAEALRLVADRHRSEAEDLLGFMLQDLRDKLEPLGKLELLDGVAKRALAYYGDQGEALSATDQRRQAQGLSNLGDVLLRRGDLQGAQRVYQASLDARQRLAAASGGERGLRNEVATSLEEVGMVLEAKGDFAAARVVYERGAELARALIREEPGNEAWHHTLCRVLNTLGNLHLSRADRAQARATFTELMAVAEPAARRWPKSVAAQRDLGIAHENRGAILELEGDLAGALAAYRAFLALAQRQAATDPDNRDFQRGVSVAYYKVADAQRARGELNDALASYGQSNVIAEQLCANDPSNAELTRDLMVGIERVGTVLERKGDLRGALAQYQRIVSMIEGLLKKAPNNALWQHDLADSLMHIAEVRKSDKDVAGALADARRALGLLEALQRKDPSSASLRGDVATCNSKIGEYQLLRGDLAGALASQQAALAVVTRLVQEDPANVVFQRALAGIYEELSKVFVGQGKAVEAKEPRTQALALVERLLAKAPGDPELTAQAARLRRAAGR